MISDTKVEKIFHPITGVLLHEIVYLNFNFEKALDFERINLSDDKEYLQGALIQIPSEHSFKAHRHLERSRNFSDLRAQETWIVIAGEVEVTYFTDEGELLKSETLHAGDVSITFRGGHSYRTTGSPSIVYEFKTGPYEGQEIDKVFI